MIIKTFLFDLDDTIVDTKIYDQLYEPVLSLVKNKFGLSDEALDQKVASLGLIKNKFGRWDTGDLCCELGLLDEYYRILEKNIEVVPVLKKDVLYFFKKARKKNKRIGIVSNSMRRTIEAFLNKYKLNEYIDFVYSFDDAKCKKSDLNYWKKLVKKHNLSPEDCVIIGDNVQQDSVIPFKVGLKAIILDDSTNLRDVSKRFSYE